MQMVRPKVQVSISRVSAFVRLHKGSSALRFKRCQSAAQKKNARRVYFFVKRVHNGVTDNSELSCKFCFARKSQEEQFTRPIKTVIIKEISIPLHLFQDSLVSYFPFEYFALEWKFLRRFHRKTVSFVEHKN